jgi:hypothetical protein
MGSYEESASKITFVTTLREENVMHCSCRDSTCVVARMAGAFSGLLRRTRCILRAQSRTLRDSVQRCERRVRHFPGQVETLLRSQPDPDVLRATEG